MLSRLASSLATLLAIGSMFYALGPLRATLKVRMCSNQNLESLALRICITLGRVWSRAV